MFSAETNFTDIGSAIQLALTPVFLLTGVAGILTVMAGRLSRIIDRGRYLTEDVIGIKVLSPTALHYELSTLEQRRNVASKAITMCTLSALLVCMVAAVLFVEAFIQINLEWLIGVLFTGSSLALVVGLAFFLWEVRLATASVRIEVPTKNT